MKIIVSPQRDQWKELLQRPYADNRNIRTEVQVILNAVKNHGDEAIRSFTKKFDGVEPESFEVSMGEIKKRQ